MTFLFLAIIFAICLVVWWSVAHRFGGWVAFGTMVIGLGLCADFAVPRGPFWFDIEDTLFSLGSYDRMGLSILGILGGLGGGLGALIGTFIGLTRRDRMHCAKPRGMDQNDRD